MSTMLMDRKKNPAALMIVSKMSSKEPTMDYPMEEKEETGDMLELAAYRMADAANLEICDMKAFVEAFKMFHQYLHEEEEKENNPWLMK